MTSISTYVQAIWDRQRAIGRKLGADLGSTGKQTRVGLLSVDVMLAVVVKTLTDKGLITDAELMAVMNAARDDTYIDEPIEPA